jgi:hypothetical protein
MPGIWPRAGFITCAFFGNSLKHNIPWGAGKPRRRPGLFCAIPLIINPPGDIPGSNVCYRIR